MGKLVLWGCFYFVGESLDRFVILREAHDGARGKWLQPYA